MMLCYLTFEYLLKFYLTRTNMMQEGDHEIYKNAPVFVQIFRSDRLYTLLQSRDWIMRQRLDRSHGCQGQNSCFVEIEINTL